LLTVTYDS